MTITHTHTRAHIVYIHHFFFIRDQWLFPLLIFSLLMAKVFFFFFEKKIFQFFTTVCMYEIHFFFLNHDHHNRWPVQRSIKISKFRFSLKKKKWIFSPAPSFIHRWQCSLSSSCIYIYISSLNLIISYNCYRSVCVCVFFSFLSTFINIDDDHEMIIFFLRENKKISYWNFVL